MTLYKSETLWDAPINGTPSKFAKLARQIEPRLKVVGERYPPSPNAHPLWTGGVLRSDANPVNLYLYAPRGNDIILSLKTHEVPDANKSWLEVYHLHWDGEPDYPEAIEVWQRLRAEMERQGFIDTQHKAESKQAALTEPPPMQAQATDATPGKPSKVAPAKPRPQSRIQAAIKQLSINRRESIRKTGKVPDLNTTLAELGDSTISRKKLNEHAQDLVANWTIKSYQAIWNYDDEKEVWEVSE